MVTTMQLDNMLTMREVSALLRIHPNTLRKWCYSGKMRAYRINSRGDFRFTREDIACFLEKMSNRVYRKAEHREIAVKGNCALRGREAEARGKMRGPVAGAKAETKRKARLGAKAERM